MSASRRTWKVRPIILTSASFIVVTALLVAAGWVFQLPLLASWVAGAPAMKVNAAICFLLMGIALSFSGRSDRVARTVVSAAAAIVATIALVTLVQHASGIDLGIDTALVRIDPSSPEAATGGRMAIGTCIAFVLLASSLLVRRLPSPQMVFARAAASYGVFIAALFVTLGYLYQAERFTSVSTVHTMALPAALAFLALSSALLLGDEQQDWLHELIASDLTGAATFRRLAPAVVAVAAVLGFLRLAGEDLGYYGTAEGVALHATLYAAVILVLITWAALRLNQSDRARMRHQDALRASEAAIRAAHDELEIKVTERTHDLRAANERLRREVADHALAQRQLRRERDRLEVASRSLASANADLQSFTYSVSHDLRTPLRGIEGFSTALLEDCGDELGPTGEGHINRIRNATRKMADLIDGLLTLSRATRAVLETGDVDLTAIAEDVVTMLRQTNAERQVSVTIAPELRATADRRLVRVVIQNLIENAWKFTASTPHARIEVGQLDDGSFFVRDNGVGFDMQYADKLFGAFQRLHTERQFPGTGIGLATVRRIIHKHGGEVRAESTPGLGAAFYFTIGTAINETDVFDDPGSDPDATRTAG